DEVAGVRVHVKQHVAQRVREHGERRGAGRRVGDGERLRVDLKNLGEALRRLLRLVREIEDEIGRDGQLALKLFYAALGQLLRHERRVEGAERRVVPDHNQTPAQQARRVYITLDEEFRLEAIILAQLVQRRERGRELHERGRVISRISVV